MTSTDDPNLLRDDLFDVRFDILSRLTVKPLLRLRVVCKPLKILIDDPHFIKLHRHRSIPNPNHLLIYHESTDYKKYYTVCTAAPDNSSLIEHKKLKFPFKAVNEYVGIVGSSDGLVCLFDTNDRSCFGDLYLWNPMVGRFRVLPDSHLSNKLSGTFSHMVVGFSFVKEIDDFKVVQLLYRSDEEIVPDGFVYSMESNSWMRVLATAPCYMPKSWATNVCLNGVIHWMAYKKPKTSRVCDTIMSFDLKDEVFGQIALPRVENTRYRQVELCVSASGDSLSLFFGFGFKKRWDVWVMKEYGVVESWTRQFTIAAKAEISLPLKFMDNGDVLLVTSKGEGKLVVCDPESQQMKDLGVCGLPGSFRVVRYMPSLILLDTGSKLLEKGSSVNK